MVAICLFTLRFLSHFPHTSAQCGRDLHFPDSIASYYWMALASGNTGRQDRRRRKVSVFLSCLCLSLSPLGDILSSD